MKNFPTIVFLFFIVMLTGCEKGCEEEEYTTIRYVPDTILQCVPYEDTETLRFHDNTGEVITYVAIRHKNYKYDLLSEECLIEHLYYNEDVTRLVPVDSGIEFTFEISSYIDNYGSFELNTGYNTFNLDTKTEFYIYSLFEDSLVVNDQYYYDVFIEEPVETDTTAGDPVLIDSLFYNYGFGILKVFLKNGNSLSLLP